MIILPQSLEIEIEKIKISRKMKIEKNIEFRRYSKIKKHEFIKKNNEYIYDDLLNQ